MRYLDLVLSALNALQSMWSNAIRNGGEIGRIDSRILRMASHYSGRVVSVRRSSSNRVKWLNREDAVYLEGEDAHVHPEDAGECGRCSALVRSNTLFGVHAGIREREEYWCGECNDNYASACETCGEVFELRCMARSEYDNDMRCASCHASHEEEHEEDEEPCDCLPDYHKAKRWDNPYPSRLPAYSAELEVLAPCAGEVITALLDAQLERTSWERDGSLEGKGFEIIVQWSPSLPHLRDRVLRVAEIVRSKGGRSWDGGLCGLHVSSNIAGWSRAQKLRVAYIAKHESLRRLLVSIAGRDSERWAKWHSDAARYWVGGYLGKYSALNFAADRLEWRIFRGSLKPERIIAYFETVALLEGLALRKMGIANAVEEARPGLAAIYARLKGGK